MSIAIVHLSDLHFRAGKHESYGVLTDSLFQDLRDQLKSYATSTAYLAFSGDIVQSGDDEAQYDDFVAKFDTEMNALGIRFDQRICVPGNHDVSRLAIQRSKVVHEGVLNECLEEEAFNDFVLSPSNVFTKKFANYLKFQTRFACSGLTDTKLTGAGWTINDEVGVYCLNTALCSSGGLSDAHNNPISDKGRLAVDTRSMYEWIGSSTHKWKILVMHHPVAWLTPWAKIEIDTATKKHFVLRLSGHEHDQSALHSVTTKSMVECSAPALFTKKTEQLGYAIILIDGDVGVREIAYRQWTKFHSFQPGVSFSNSDDGKIQIASIATSIANPLEGRSEGGFIDRFLRRRLDDALKSFHGQPSVWTAPTLKKTRETTRETTDGTTVSVSDLLTNPNSTIIAAPPQFGLTCLSHFLIAEAWKGGARWIYLDAKEIKPNAHSIKSAVDQELELYGDGVADVSCVILDSWTTQDKDAQKLLQKVCTHFDTVRVVCMQTIETDRFASAADDAPINRKFERLYLWALSRAGVRSIVSAYNATNRIADDDVVTKKVTTDLAVLNLHRTPLNCLTLLKVSEIDFDESPVNRSEMIKRVLFLLFNMDAVPTYKVRPDLKDCEYVLGYFCETMLKDGQYVFSREHFLNTLTRCCVERFIDLDVHVVFDVLYTNSILLKRDGRFCFRAAYWVSYFAAQRMHNDESFAKYILQNYRYAEYPQIIEFYSGIDRRRVDALEQLIGDLRACREKVESKCRLPDELNPYRILQWTPSEAVVKKMQAELISGIKESNLPTEIKDHYADRGNDRAKPYSQDIRHVLADFSLVRMMSVMKAGAKALRNSDYAAPNIKRELLREILSSWHVSSNVLLVLLPLLADKGEAVFDGCGFVVQGQFGASFEERLRNILEVIPENVVRWCEDDLFSQKMGPLLIDGLSSGVSEISKHELLLLLIRQRPRGWKTQVQNYIASVAKNSFYLLDVNRHLRGEYKFAYASSQTLKDMEFLIEMAVTKHVTGHDAPGATLIAKTISKIQNMDDIIPKREV